jgi:RNA polymerase sigma-70 factor (ECF subfamily)
LRAPAIAGWDPLQAENLKIFCKESLGTVTYWLKKEALSVTADLRESLFRQWLEEHKGLVFRVVRAYAVGPEQQEELLQDILVQLWSSIPSFRGESNSSTWVYRVALNTALAGQRAARKRRQRYRPLLEVGEKADPGGSPVAQQADMVEKLYAGIRQLPEADRSLVLLHLDGLSYREMADILGISESNVGASLTRARKKLAELLKGVGDEP